MYIEKVGLFDFIYVAGLGFPVVRFRARGAANRPGPFLPPRTWRIPAKEKGRDDFQFGWNGPMTE